jgi:hypothetical protein
VLIQCPKSARSRRLPGLLVPFAREWVSNRWHDVPKCNNIFQLKQKYVNVNLDAKHLLIGI